MATAVVMDLLYENQLYAECCDLALQLLHKKPDIHTRRLEPILTLAFLSGFNLVMLQQYFPYTRMFVSDQFEESTNF